MGFGDPRGDNEGMSAPTVPLSRLCGRRFGGKDVVKPTPRRFAISRGSGFDRAGEGASPTPSPHLRRQQQGYEYKKHSDEYMKHSGGGPDGGSPHQHLRVCITVRLERGAGGSDPPPHRNFSPPPSKKIKHPLQYEAIPPNTKPPPNFKANRKYNKLRKIKPPPPNINH